MFSPTDTIVAIATPSGRGGIGVVRISGPRATEIAGAVLATPRALDPRHATHTFVQLGRSRQAAPEAASRGSDQTRIDCHASSAGFEPLRAHDSPTGPASSVAVPGFSSTSKIDEVVATFFPAPHSYTTEDVVEICGHGSPPVLREIVRAAIAEGARLAEPGEFTFRAYLGGRIDLVQAEAVGDLVDAVTPLQARVAFDQLEGTLTRSIAALDAPLFDLVTRLEASIDFPEEGYHFVDPDTVRATLREICSGIDGLLGGAHLGRVIREGRQIAIVGKPNVGKSSLFNWLLGAERAIVTGVPGTTRDLLRETVDFEGVRLSLVDTAGSRDVQDEIEREGVARAHRVHDAADLVCVVLDISRPLDADDDGVLERTTKVPRVIVVNKADLPHAWDPGEIVGAQAESQDPGRGMPREDGVVREHAAAEQVPLRSQALQPPRRVRELDSCNQRPGEARRTRSAVTISLKTGVGISGLRDAIRRALELAEPRVEEPLVTNIRHESLLRQARESISRAVEGLEAMGERLNEELVLADLAAARRAFDEVVGKRASEDVLREIFARFCVGK